MNASFQESFRHGLDEFNGERFFEAHEAWEQVWLASAGQEKRFLQGIIQIAAAFHHYRRGNWQGACSLLEAGLSRLHGLPANHGGIELAELRLAASEWIRELRAGRDPGHGLLPKIRMAERGQNGEEYSSEEG